MRSVVSLAVTALVAVLLAGCGSSGSGGSTSAGAGSSGSAASGGYGAAGGSGGYGAGGGRSYGSGSSSPSTPTSGSRRLALADTSLGRILVAPDGRTLYSFEPDQQGASTCYAQCAVLWHALTGPVTPGNGVDPAKVGSVQRRDGSSQVTYNGWPLYTYTQDGGPGDVNGQGVKGVWWVLDSTGAPVH